MLYMSSKIQRQVCTLNRDSYPTYEKSDPALIKALLAQNQNTQSARQGVRGSRSHTWSIKLKYRRSQPGRRCMRLPRRRGRGPSGRKGNGRDANVLLRMRMFVVCHNIHFVDMICRIGVYNITRRSFSI